MGEMCSGIVVEVALYQGYLMILHAQMNAAD